MRLWAIVGLALVAGCVNRTVLDTTASMEVNPPAVPADGVSYATVTVTASDPSEGLTNSTSLLLQSSEPSVTITQFGTRDEHGLYHARISSAVPGTATLSVVASDGTRTVALPTTGVVTFHALVKPGEPSAQTSWLNADPNLVADDGHEVTLLTLHVLDGNGIPVPAVAVSFASSGTNNAFTPEVGLTGPDGMLTATLASTTPETKTVTAYTPAMAVSTQVTFSPLGASTLFSTLRANPNSVAADGVSSTTLTFTVQDAEGLPLPGAPVAWSSTGSRNTLVANGVVTDGNGMATATLSSSMAATKTITARSGTMQVSQSVAFIPGAPSGTACTFMANPNLLMADNAAASVLTFTAADAFGNAVPNVSVSLAVTGSDNTLAPASGTTNAAGVFTATLTSGKAEAKSVTATTTGGINLTQTVTFFAGQPAAGSSSFTANPTTVTADGVSTTTLTVTLDDAQGNPTPGQTVTFAASGASNTFGQVSGTTNASGQVSTTLVSTTAETKVVLASVGGSALSADVTFVSGQAASTLTTLTASPTTAVADGNSTTQLTAVVRDAFGNAVPFQAVTLSSTGSNNVLTPASGITDDTGTFTAAVNSTTAEVKTIMVTAGGATANATVTFVAGAPAGTTSTFVASPTSLTADGSAHSTLTVAVYDAFGNPVGGQGVSLTSSGSNNTLSPASGSTNSAGVFTATLASTTAETKNLTATVGSVTMNASVTFVPGAPASAMTTLAASPNTLTANAASVTTLTVTVLDAQGNPVPNQAVALSASGSNNIFGSPNGTTDSSGVYSTTLASSSAQAKTVTATVGSVTKATTVMFTAGSPTSAASTLSANPTSLTADGNSTTQLTFVVKDSFGNPVPNQAVTLSSTGSNNTLTPASGTTDSTGTFAATLASTKAEAKTVTGTAGSATATTTVTFNAGAVASTTTTLVANPNTVAADGSSTSTLVATALDAQGNPVAGQPVTLSASGTSNTFLPTNGSTNSAGIFTSTLSSTTQQTETVSALVAGAVTANANVTFIAPVVSTTLSTIAASPNALVADGSATSTIAVTVVNGSNQPVVNASVNMSATGGNNTFTPVSGTTNSAGVFTTTLSSTQAAVKTVTATVDGATLNTTVTFSPGVPSSTTTTLVASPNSVTADGTSQSTLTVVVVDVHGNPEPNQTVSLTATGSNNTLSPALGTTDATGTFTATLTSVTAEAKTVTATVAGSFTKNTTVTFVPGTVSGVTTTFVASPNSTTADGNSTVTLTTTVKDGEGNPVANQTVVLSGTGSNNIFAPPSGSTNSAGVFTATITSTKAELKSITAVIGTVNENANVLFVAGAVSGITSTLVLNPTSVTANGNTAAVQVTVEDAHGNPVANQNVALSGNGTANTFTPVTGHTDPNGLFAATLSSTVAQTETITAAVGTVNLTAAMTFTAGSPNSTTSTLSASLTTLVANGVATTALTVTVKDAYGNPVRGQAVSLSSSGTSNTITPTSGNTSVSGVFTATLSSTKAEVKLVTATIGGFTETASVTFTAGSPNSTATTFVASPTTVTADGVQTSTLTVTVEDTYGNPVPNQTVTFSSTGSNNTFSSASGATNASGVFSATMVSTTAEIKTVTATAGAVVPTATVTFVAGAPVSGMSSVGALPAIVTANGTSTAGITVTVKDAYGNAVPNQSVSVGANGSANTWGATSGTTNSAGVWSTTLASTLAQSELITASIGTVTETTTVSFVAGAASSSTSMLSASPNSLADDGVATTTLQVTVDDATGNAINSQAVTFNSTGTNLTFSSTTCSTNTVGQCSVTLKSTTAQVATMSAKFAGVTENANVTFVTGAASSATSTIAASPTTLTADGTATTTLTVTAKDATGNLISGQSVTLSSTGSMFTFTPAAGTTNAAGVFKATMASTMAEVKTVTATLGAATENASITFVAGSPNALQSSFTALPSSVVADGNTPCNLTLTVMDAYGNPVPGQAATFSASGTTNTFTPMSGTTAASGVLSSVLTSTKAQAETVTVKTATMTFTSAVTFVAGSPSSVMSTLTASPNTVSANGTSVTALTFLVEDAKGNPIPGQPVSIGSTGSNNTFSVSNGNTNAAGIWTVTLASSTAETKTVTATAGVVNIGVTVTFVNGPTYTTGSIGTVTTSPAQLYSGDFNYDGKLDLVLSKPGTSVYLLYGQGNGTFAAPTTVTVTNQTSIAVGDYNADGYMDFISVVAGAGNVILELNNKSGGFTPSTYLSGSGFYTYGNVAACYIDYGSSYPDDSLVDGCATLFYSTTYCGAEGGINVSQMGGGVAAYSMCSNLTASYTIGADFASNGNTLFAVSGGSKVSIFLENTTPMPPEQYILPSNGNMMVLGDVDHDGFQDIIVATSPVTVLYYSGSGLPFLLTSPAAVTGNNNLWVQTADFNNDGHADAALSAGNGVNVGLGSATRGSMTLDQFTTGHPAAAVAIGDYNGDGILDLATANSDNGSISVLLVQSY